VAVAGLGLLRRLGRLGIGLLGLAVRLLGRLSVRRLRRLRLLSVRLLGRAEAALRGLGWLVRRLVRRWWRLRHLRSAFGALVAVTCRTPA
ncbi:hypothetical protein, partial [Streptomyces beijiangensis]